MTDRILDISGFAGSLRVRHERLVLKSDAKEQAVPLAEVAVLVVSNPAVTYTQAVLAKLMEHGGAFVSCGANRLPNGFMLPLEAHHLQTERIKQQVEASEPVRKRVWQQLVTAKISAQGKLLGDLHGDDKGLLAMAKRVRSGDPDNFEGVASQRYWPAVFGDAGFRRDRDLPGKNAMLNYGYGVLRAIVGRAIVAAGLHPSIGVHHHNRYDAFCLADDVMEPYRPIVDRTVAVYLRENPEPAELDKEVKRPLLEAMMGRHIVQGEERSLFDVVAQTAVSLVKIFQGSRKKLVIPEL